MRRCAQGSGWCRVRAVGAGVGLLVQRVGVAFAWDLHDRQARPSSVRVGPCTAVSSAWRSCCLLAIFDIFPKRPLGLRVFSTRFGSDDVCGYGYVGACRVGSGR